MQTLTQHPSHWRQHPWVWFLIAIPLSAVIMGFLMLALAIQSDSGLVVDDYYKQGKQINRSLARDRAASELGLSAVLGIDPLEQSVTVRIEPFLEVLNRETIHLSFIHATRPGLDQAVQLEREGNSLVGKLQPLGAGRWNLSLHTDSWRLTASLYAPRQSVIKLQAQKLSD